MKPRDQANIWNLKTFQPYFEEIKFGRKRFDVRRTKPEFPIKKGDWIVFALYHSKHNKFLNEYIVKAIDYVLNTAEATFWADHHKTFSGFTIMQLVDPTCPKCEHTVQMIYERDGGFEEGFHDTSYFQCYSKYISCDCLCDEVIILDAGLNFVGEDGLVDVE